MAFIPDIESTAESKIELKLNFPAVCTSSFSPLSQRSGLICPANNITGTPLAILQSKFKTVNCTW